MARTLRAGKYLAGSLLAISLLLLVAGLAMVARPEAFAGLGLHDPARIGLQIALASGFGAIASAVMARILALLHSTLDDENGV